MNNPFQSTSRRKPKRNVFDLSCEYKGSGKFAGLYPVLWDEIVPGDSWRVRTEIFMRFAPMIAPVMHRINVFMHYFWVPTRIIFDEWKDYITGGEDGDDTTSHPVMNYKYSNRDHFYKGMLSDYLGIPPADDFTASVVTGIAINALPFRAYQMIYNEFYRDQNLETAVVFGTGESTSGDIDALTELRYRMWEKDYLTSCLPWTQRGTQSGIPVDLQYATYTDWSGVSTGAVTVDAVTNRIEVDGSDSGTLQNLDETTTNIDIIELRKSLRLQEYLETNARVGSRYVEQLKGRFGTYLPDMTYRPTYLGGSKSPVSISEVLNTSDTTNADQGAMAGHGLVVGGGHGFNYTFNEHGYIMGIMSVLPRTAYQDGINRKWVKDDKFDYFTPEFARVGEQEVYDWELWCPDDAEPSTDVFGYQQRYGHLKYKNSSVHGDFRDDFAHWHLGRQFSSQPTLNTEFVEADSARTDIFAVDDGSDYLWFQLYHDIKAIRPIPYYSEPSL